MIPYIALGLVFLLMIGTYITEHALNKDSENYKCLMKQQFRGKAYADKCPGYDKSCKKCQYKKNYDKEVKNDS